MPPANLATGSIATLTTIVNAKPGRLLYQGSVEIRMLDGCMGLAHLDL